MRIHLEREMERMERDLDDPMLSEQEKREIEEELRDMERELDDEDRWLDEGRERGWA